MAKASRERSHMMIGYQVGKWEIRIFLRDANTRRPVCAGESGTDSMELHDEGDTASTALMEQLDQLTAELNIETKSKGETWQQLGEPVVSAVEREAAKVDGSSVDESADDAQSEGFAGRVVGVRIAVALASTEQISAGRLGIDGQQER